jgi:lipase
VLYLHEFGASGAAPLVALHGVKGQGGRWRRLAETGRQVYGLDLRGHGRSTGDAPWNLERHALDVLATLDTLRLDSTDLVGHSFGAAAAIYAARLAPARVRRLVLLDPALGIDPAEAARRGAEALTVPSFTDPAEALAAQRREWPEVADGSFVADEVDANLVCSPDGRWRWRWQPAAMVTAFSEVARPAVAPPASVPTLLLRAARTQVVTADLLAVCAEADVTVVDVDCGHMMLEERPAEVLGLVRDFLG